MWTSSTRCRACLNESLESYFEMNNQCHFTSEDLSFKDVFNFCTHLDVQINDGSPQRICVLCVEDLQQTYTFLQKVIGSNKKLNELKDNKDMNKDNDVYLNNDDFLKDPLENVTDNEDSIDKETKPETIEDNNDEYSCSSLDKIDNIVEDSQLITPYLNDSDDDHDDDKDEGNFFKSVESQIFPQGRLKCKICFKAYFTNEGLQAHMEIHLPKGISKSPLMVSKTRRKKNVIKNSILDDETIPNQETMITKDENKIKLPKPKKTFPCEVCGKHMISASKLRYHMVMHTGEKDYLCTMCPKAYSTIYALKHHMRAHTGERPYECKFCGDRFLRPTTLKSHMRRHTGERPYGCDICGKRFIQHSSMATHMKLNHMDKTIPCPYCDKKYARQTDLNTHLLSHSGDKPFACQMCSSRFTRQSNLNKHINQHHNGINIGDKKSMKYNTLNNVSAREESTDGVNAGNVNTKLSADYDQEKPTCSMKLNASLENTSQHHADFQEIPYNAKWNWPNKT